MNIPKPKQINLTLPKHWNLCTTEQLELIADIMREQVDRQDRYHPFSMQAVKVAVFFALSGIEIVEGPNPRIPVEEQYYTCRLATKEHHRSLFSVVFTARHPQEEETFSLYLWQINYWLTSPAKTDNKSSPEYIAQGAGILDWLENKQGRYLTKFAYPQVSLRNHTHWYAFKKKSFEGPRTDLDGFSWSQYRFASDMMGTYTKLSNSLIKMEQIGTFSEEQMMKQAHSIDLAKSMFLATIFNAKTKYVDTNTGIIKRGYHYESNQCSDNAQYFRDFPETQWQVILFWWTGIMHTLAKRYPHVFKVQKVSKSDKPSTPLEIYTATTATMQKYTGQTEDEVNHQSYSLVLEHLERLSKENEEMERIRSKH